MLSLSSCNSCSSKKEEPQGPSPTKFEESMEKGMKQGMEKGMKQGMEKGMKQGMAKGEEAGKSQRSIEIAKNMLAKGMDASTVMEITGLTETQMQQLM